MIETETPELLVSEPGLFESVFEQSPMAFFLVSEVKNTRGKTIDFEFVRLNEAAQKLMGKKTEGSLLVEKKTDEQKNLLFKKLHTALEKKKPVEMGHFIAPDGQEIWLRMTASRIGGIVLICAEDITAHKNTEIDFIENANLLQSVFETSLTGIAVIKSIRNENNQITDFEFSLLNAKAHEILGTNVVGRKISEVIKTLHSTAFIAYARKVIEKGAMFDTEQFYSNNGLKGWYHIKAAKLGDGLVLNFDNISERKMAQLELERTTSLLENVFDSSLHTISVQKPIYNASGEIEDFFILKVNQASINMAGGINPEGQRYTQVFPFVVELGMFDKFRQVFTTGIPDDFELHYTRDEHDFWLRVIARRSDDLLIVRSENISQRKKTEQEIKAQAHFIRTITDTMPDVVTVVEHPSAKIIYSNHNTLNLMGFDGDEIITMDPGERRMLLHPDDEPAVMDYYERFRQMQDHEENTVQYRVKNKNNEWTWLSVRGKVFQRDQKGHVTQTLHIAQDVQARKKAEMELLESNLSLKEAQALGQIGDFDFDTERNTVRWSNELYHIMKVPVGEPMDFEKALSFYVDEDRERLKSLSIQILETGIPFEMEVAFIPRDGSEKKHLFIRAERKGLHHIKGIVQDITERKKTEQEILRLKDEIAQRATDKYQALFNSIDQGFNVIELIFDRNGKVIDHWQREHNPVFTQLTGINNATGKKMSELASYVEPEWYRMVENIYYTGEPARIEHHVPALGKWYRIYMSRVGGKGSPLIACVYDDITERKQRERQQEFLLQFSDTLRTLTNQETIENISLQLLSEFLNIDRAYIITSHMLEDRAVVRAEYNPSSQFSISVESNFPNSIGQIEQQTLVIENVRTDRALSESDKASLAAINLAALVSYSLRQDERNVVWSFVAANSTPRIWTKNEMALIETIAERTWAAVERVKTEEALKKSEAKLRRLSDSGIVAIAFFDIDGPIVDANNAFLDLLGVRREELSSEKVRWNVYTHENWMQRTLEAMEEFKDTGFIKPYEKQFYHSSGEVKWGVFAGASLGDGRTGVSLVLDITDRKKAEEDLRKNQEQLKTFIEAVPAAISLVDLNGRMTISNSEMKRFIPGQVIPSKDANATWRWKSWNADGTPVDPQNFPEARALRGENVYPGMEMLYTKDDGSQVWTRVSSLPIRDKEGNITGSVSAITDINELKRYAEALQKSKELIQSKELIESAFNTASIGITVFKAKRSPEGYIIAFTCEMASKKAHEFTGREHLNSLDVFEIFADAWKYTADLKNVVESGKRFVCETMTGTRDNEQFFRHTHIKFDDGFICLTEDITEKKLMQRGNFLAQISGGGKMGEFIRTKDWSLTSLGPIESWPQSLKTSVNLMLNSQQPTWIGWGPDALFFYNDAYIPVLSRSKHPMALGLPAHQVWKEIWDFCGPLAEKVFKKGEASFVDDVRLLLFRGSYYEETYHCFSYSPIRDETGHVAGMFCPVTEVTDKKLTARRLKTLTELAANALVEKSIKAACTTAFDTLGRNTNDVPFAMLYLVEEGGKSARLEQQVGLPAASPLLNDVRIDLDDSTALLHFPIPEVFATARFKTAFTDQKFLIPKGPGEQDTTQAIILPVMASGEESPIGILIAGINPARRLDNNYVNFFELISGQVGLAIENARSAEEEKKHIDLLAEVDQAKTTFFSNVSHEFRTPLTLMLGPLEELRENADVPATMQEHLRMVHHNALRLQKLVNSLLDFSRIESGRLSAAYQPTDVGELTCELADNFRSAIERAGMQLVTECEHIENVYLDRDMWEKIVLNLLSNAFKYTYKGKIEVRLKKTGKHFDLTVADTGIGITPSETRKIFDRFYTVHNVKGRTQEGTGIGLSLIKELVKMHRGTIRVKSEPGKGSVFTVSIPIGKDHLPKDRIIKNFSLRFYEEKNIYVSEAMRWLPDDKKEKKPRNDKKKPLILLCDDNADMRSYIRRVLGQQYKVIMATNGRDALELLHQKTPDMVLADIMMPVMNGLELLKEIRQTPSLSHLPFMLVSAKASEEDRLKGIEVGADFYLVKPFAAKELVSGISTIGRIAQERKKRWEQETRHEEMEKTFREQIKRMTDENKALLNTNQELQQFNTFTSHDLKEPIREIQTYCRLLKNEVETGNANAQKYLTQIDHLSHRMNDLVHSVLDQSMLSETRKSFMMVDLDITMKKVVSELSFLVSETNATIDFRPLPRIRGNLFQVHQLLHNLLETALNLSDTEPKITLRHETPKANIIRKYKLDENSSYIGLRLNVEAKSFRKDVLEKTFRLFSQPGSTVTETGLAICKKIIDNHRGIFDWGYDTGKYYFYIILPAEEL